MSGTKGTYHGGERIQVIDSGLIVSSEGYGEAASLIGL